MNEECILRHVVLFEFKRNTTDEEISSIAGSFMALKETIPYIIDIEWGRDISVEGLSEDYTHCFLLTFKDENYRDDYLVHPAHANFQSILNPCLEKALAFDYLAKK